MKPIYRGAEAVLYLEKKGGKDEEQVLVKERIKKGYRIPELDESIRKRRTKREESLMSRARRSGVTVPQVLDIDVKDSKIFMEFIDGKKVKDVFNGMPAREREIIYKLIGENVALMHKNNIIHGDLTTSNFIFIKSGKKLYIIDFGLGKYSEKVEDQAVDLFVLYEAFKSAHFKYLSQAWQNILKAYSHSYSNAKTVLKRIEKIKTRRRYK